MTYNVFGGTLNLALSIFRAFLADFGDTQTSAKCL